MKRKRFLLVVLIVMGFGIGVVMFSYLQQDNTITPQVEGEQERMGRVPSTATETSEPHKDSEDITPVEIPEQVEREISGLVEQPQMLSAPETVETDEENPPTPEEPADPVAVAWARLEYISQNPQEWGDFSPEATELMEQLTPMWRPKTRSETEEVIVLLEELGKLHDPRSAEIFVHYLNGNGPWIGYVEAALIAIGPPSVPPLIPVLDQNGSYSNFFKKKRAAKLLGIIGSEYQQELGGAVEYILLPKLEELTMLYPDYYGVRVVASEAISRLRSYEQDSSVASQIERKRQRTDRVIATAAETNEQSQISQPLEPVEEDGEGLPAPEEPADPVTAAWARLEYISQNPQEWGEFSPEAVELMAQLTPTRTISTKEEMEEVIVLLEKLGKLRDSRSVQIIMNYFLEVGLWEKPMKEALIAIGPPSVPLLIPLLDPDTQLLGKLIGAKLLGIIGSEHRQELGDAVEHIILPKLEKLVTSDPSPRVRWYASVAISRIRYRQQDNTVEPPEQIKGEINETIEQPQVSHVLESVAAHEEDSTEEPADPVAAAWARLEYISQNPQEWGEFSPEATKLMEQLTPTRTMPTEGEGEEAIELLDRLTKFQDPRSPEIFVNYMRAGIGGRPMEAALITIGPPSVLPLISLLADNDGFLNRKRAAELLGIIGIEYQEELGDVVKYILLPKLKELATSDPNPRVREVAGEAISRFGYQSPDNTVTPQPDKPANPVAAAWARLEYISQNPQEWGEFSPEAAELMAQLTPTWDFDAELGEGLAEDAFKLLKKLVSFQDPRSAEVIANYINEGFGLSNEDLIPIGLPLVPALIPLLDTNASFEGRLQSVKILGILGEKHRHELGGAVEHIVLPKLKALATSDPSPVVQRRAHEAGARLR